MPNVRSVRLGPRRQERWPFAGPCRTLPRCSSGMGGVMPARTGRQYLYGLREQDREVWLAGERVRDVTTHPGLKNGARAIASLYDMQCDPNLRDEMTYV